MFFTQSSEYTKRQYRFAHLEKIMPPLNDRLSTHQYVVLTIANIRLKRQHNLQSVLDFLRTGKKLETQLRLVAAPSVVITTDMGQKVRIINQNGKVHVRSL